jgi:hypothetical protein
MLGEPIPPRKLLECFAPRPWMLFGRAVRPLPSGQRCDLLWLSKSNQGRKCRKTWLMAILMAR